MKVFVSGQIAEKEEIRRSYDVLMRHGFEVTHDWTRTDDIGDKLANRAESGRRAKADIDGVGGCDIYVLMSTNREPGKGMYVELGAALARRELTGKPDIYVVGPMNHLSIFYLHPAVCHVDSLDQLIHSLGPFAVSS